MKKIEQQLMLLEAGRFEMFRNSTTIQVLYSAPHVCIDAASTYKPSRDSEGSDRSSQA